MNPRGPFLRHRQIAAFALLWMLLSPALQADSFLSRSMSSTSQLSSQMASGLKNHPKCQQLMGWFGGIRRVRQVQASEWRNVVSTISGQKNVYGLTFEESKQKVEKVLKLYEAHGEKKATMLRAKKRFQERIDLAKDLLSKSLASSFPLEVFLPASPSIDHDQIDGDWETDLKARIRFKKESELEAFVRAEEKELRVIASLFRKEEEAQALRHWRLLELAKAFGPWKELDSSVKVETLPYRMQIHYRLTQIQSGPKSPELTPEKWARDLIWRAAELDKSASKQLAAGSLNRLGRGLVKAEAASKKINVIVDRILTPTTSYQKIVLLLVTISGTYLAVPPAWNKLVTWWTYDEAALAALEKQKEINDRIFQIAGKSVDWTDFFNRFYEDAVATWPDESIEIALEYVLGKRTDFKPQGPNDPYGRLDTWYFTTAEEIANFFKILLDEADERMARREANYDKVLSVRDIAEVGRIEELIKELKERLESKKENHPGLASLEQEKNTSP